MSDGKGACEGREERRARASINILRVVSFFFLFEIAVVPPSSKKSIPLTSGRDELLVLFDGPDGPAELLPRGELLAGGRHGS